MNYKHNISLSHFDYLAIWHEVVHDFLAILQNPKHFLMYPIFHILVCEVVTFGLTGMDAIRDSSGV